MGEKDAVTPLGKPETDRFTLPVKPYCGLTYTYVVVEWPCPMVAEPPPESVKVGALTLSDNAAVCVMLPETPVIVSGYCPTATVPATASVSVDEPVVGFGFQRAVTPEGKPETFSVTLLLKPY